MEEKYSAYKKIWIKGNIIRVSLCTKPVDTSADWIWRSDGTWPGPTFRTKSDLVRSKISTISFQSDWKLLYVVVYLTMSGSPYCRSDQVNKCESLPLCRPGQITNVNLNFESKIWIQNLNIQMNPNLIIWHSTTNMNFPYVSNNLSMVMKHAGLVWK